MNLIFKQLKSSDPDLTEVILPSIGNPTTEKITSTLESYNYKNHFIIGSFLNTKLVGMIGIETNNNSAIIRHINVLKEFQKQGIARKLVQYIIDHFSLKELYAETDGEAGFYHSLGFKCEEFSTEYGIRYKCYLENIAI